MHLIPKIWLVLFKKGHILVIIDGGITGDIKINGTHCHRRLKSQYWHLEMKLISVTKWDDMSWKKLQIDTEKEFKSWFVTNALDCSENYLISDELRSDWRRNAEVSKRFTVVKAYQNSGRSRKKVNATKRNKSQRKCWGKRAIRL